MIGLFVFCSFMSAKVVILSFYVKKQVSMLNSFDLCLVNLINL